MVLVNFFNVIKCIILNNPLVNFVEEEILLLQKKKSVCQREVEDLQSSMETHKKEDQSPPRAMLV